MVRAKFARVPSLILLVAALLGVWIVFAVVWQVVTRVPKSEKTAVAQNEAPPSLPFEYPRLIDGIMVSSTEHASPLVAAIMVDFNAGAYPISSIDRARVVYEAPVEGSITRLMAIFPLDVPVPEVGPVRSARPYFIEWASEYAALYAHVGGSPAALVRLYDKNEKPVIDVNEFSAGPYFWRDHRRYAPYNVYTNSERLQSLVAARGVATSSVFSSWLFAPLVPSEWDAAERVAIPAGSFGRGAEWKHVKDARGAGQGAYVRQYGRGEYRTRDGELVRADNLVIQETSVRVLDREGRLDVTTTATGTAWIFRDGMTARGVWKYVAAEHRTRWYDSAGDEIALKPGNTWIHVVPIGVAPVVRNP